MKKSKIFSVLGLVSLCFCLLAVMASAQTAEKVVFQDGETVVAEMTVGQVVVPDYKPQQGVLVCWQTKVDGKQLLLRPQETHTFSAAAVLTPVVVDLTTLTTPTPRFDENDVGLRFLTHMPLSDWNALSALGFTVERGTLIIPYHYYSAIEKQLTHAALESHGKQYLDVTTKGWYTGEGIAAATKPEDRAYFAGSVTNILFSNHAVRYTAIGYLRITAGDRSFYVYANTDTGKAFFCSPWQMAYSALTDTKSAPEGKYTHKRGAAFSPYNKTQQEMLGTFTASVISLVQNSKVPGGRELDADVSPYDGGVYQQRFVREGDADWPAMLQYVGIKQTGVLVIYLPDGKQLTPENVAGVVISAKTYQGFTMAPSTDYIFAEGRVLIPYSEYTDNY